MENVLSINEWSINFWIKENTIVYNDSKNTELFNLNPKGGSIFMIKGDNNLFKIMYVVIWKWRIDLEYNVSNMDINKNNMITVTWNIENDLILYINWTEVKKEKVSFK